MCSSSARESPTGTQISRMLQVEQCTLHVATCSGWNAAGFRLERRNIEGDDIAVASRECPEARRPDSASRARDDALDFAVLRWNPKTPMAVGRYASGATEKFRQGATPRSPTEVVRLNLKSAFTVVPIELDRCHPRQKPR